jgi:RNA polymerase sigma factor (sigma-70 family)
MRPISDDEAIAASRVSPVAFGDVFDRHWPAVRRYLVLRVGADLGEELAAEVFARAFARRHVYKDGDGDARPWLYGIAANLVRDHRRRERRHTAAMARLDRVATETSQPPDVSAVMSQLARMSLGTREAVALWVWGELTYEQIAQALDIPVGTVRSRLSRARSALASTAQAAARTAVSTPSMEPCDV